MNSSSVIAVTGANRGIGAAISVELARRGHRVACLSRGGGLPEEEVSLEGSGSLEPHTCDVTDEEALRTAFSAIVERHGRLDGLVNNAGIHLPGDSAEYPTADFVKTMNTNAAGAFTACREAHPHLAKAGGGLIVNIGSFFDKLGVIRNVAYSASKAAVGAITRCLAVEWATDGIRLINVAPGYIETDLNREFLERDSVQTFLAMRIPYGGPGVPEDVARLVAALYGEDLPFLTGETIYIDGGHSIAQ